MSDAALLNRKERPLITDSVAWFRWSPQLAKLFEFDSRFADQDGNAVTVQLWERDGDFIKLPRAAFPVGVVDERTPGVKCKFPHAPVPRKNQVEVFDQTVAFLRAGQSGIVEAYTGFGKTVLGMYAIHAIGVKTLIITTKDDVYRQWIDAAKQFLQLPDHLIGEIRANRCEVIGPVVCVAMIHSLSKPNKYPPEVLALFDDFGLVIFDEVQRLPADQFQACAAMFKARLRLALSAAFRRKDGKDLVILTNIGPVRVKTKAELMVPKVIIVPTDWKCPRYYQKGEDGQLIADPSGQPRRFVMPHSGGRTSRIEKVLMRDDARSDLIASYIKQAYDKGRTIVVFSTLHEHLLALARACKAAGVPKPDMMFYIHATSKAEKAKRALDLAKTRVAFTTPGMMGEGTDADQLDTCVLAMPRADVMQAVGRIRRTREGKRTALVIDFADYDSPIFTGYAASRLKWYKSIGAEIIQA